MSMDSSILLFLEHAAVLDIEAEKTEELTEEQKEMMSVMGFTDFVSTKVGAVLDFQPASLELDGFLLYGCAFTQCFYAVGWAAGRASGL